MAEIINVELEQEVELQTSYELSGGIIPTGTINITTNGTHDVSSYADANVNVQGGITPTGTKSISANGTGIDVKAYEYVDVSVSGGSSIATGTYTPTENTLKPTIAVGQTFDHFLIYTEDTATGHGVKTIKGVKVSFASGSNNGTNNFGVTTNNSGSAHALFMESSNGGNQIFQRSGNNFVVANNWSSGTGGYFGAGLTYKWFAWSN